MDPKSHPQGEAPGPNGEGSPRPAWERSRRAGKERSAGRVTGWVSGAGALDCEPQNERIVGIWGHSRDEMGLPSPGKGWPAGWPQGLPPLTALRSAIGAESTRSRLPSSQLLGAENVSVMDDQGNAVDGRRLGDRTSCTAAPARPQITPLPVTNIGTARVAARGT